MADEKTDPAFNEKIFKESLDLAIMQTPHGSYEKVNLVFFPILKKSKSKSGNHFYLICVNLKVPRVDIIDNIKSNEKKVFKRYGHLPSKLVSFFSKYLAKEKHPMTMDLMSVDPQTVDIPWATKKNAIDCGVFVMRHMECYMGTGLKNFSTEFENEGVVQTRQIESLRRRYLAKILLSDLNDIREAICAKVKEFDRLKDEERQDRSKNAKERISNRLKDCVGDYY